MRDFCHLDRVAPVVAFENFLLTEMNRAPWEGDLYEIDLSRYSRRALTGQRALSTLPLSCSPVSEGMLMEGDVSPGF